MAPAVVPFDCSYLSDMSSIARARAALTQFATAAGVVGDKLDDVRLCVSEAVSNAVLHAYAHSDRGSVRVVAVASGGELLIHVSDDGCGLRRESPNPGLGFGVPLMYRLCDGLVVRERALGGVEVHLRFDLLNVPVPTRSQQGV